MRTLLLVSVVGVACWLAGARTLTQEPTEASMKAMMDAIPKPTAQHKALHDRVGVWDAECKLYMGPEPMISKATMTYEALGQFWIVGTYEGEIMGAPFTGLDISGYDPESGEHVSYWIDTSSPEFTETRGTWAEGATSMTMRSVQPHKNPMTGQADTLVQTVKQTDADHIHFTMGTEGSPTATMEIAYTRRK